MRTYRTISSLLAAILPAALVLGTLGAILGAGLTGCLTTKPPNWAAEAGAGRGTPAAGVSPASAQTVAAADTTVLPAGKFTVQVGAYQSRPSAERTAGVASDRFARDSYAFFDVEGNVFKVFVGVFDSKEEARRFRDKMAQQFPQDYRDAWVAELKK